MVRRIGFLHRLKEGKKGKDRVTNLNMYAQGERAEKEYR